MGEIERRTNMNKMLRILFLLLFFSFCIKSTAYAKSTSYDEFVKSMEYSEIISLTDIIKENVESIYQAEYKNNTTLNSDVITFDNIEKIYIDTGIETVQSDKKEDILKLLERSDYVWVVPLEIEGKNIEVTLAQGLPFNESIADVLTPEEAQEIKDNEGKWIITQITVDASQTYTRLINENVKNTKIEQVVLVGGIPGIINPIGIGFTGDKATHWVNIDNVLNIDEKNRSGESSTNLLDFNTTLDQIEEHYNKTKDLPEGSMMGGELQISSDAYAISQENSSLTKESINKIENKPSPYSMKWLSFLIVSILIILAIFFILLRRRKQVK